MPVSREVVLYSVAGALGLSAAAAGIILAGRKIFCARSAGNDGSKLYETEKLLNEYIGFHFCPPKEYVTYDFCPHDALDFPKRCADLCVQYKPDGVVNRALDIGCAVGRSTFELAREYDEVVGLDFSQVFIGTCQTLKMMGEVQYLLRVEGDLVESKTAAVDPAIDRSRTSFTVGDACNLPDLGKFGCVFAANLICRLPEPAKFYSRLPEIIVPGGLLFITSPYTWLGTYTDKDKWIGGYKLGNEEVRGFSALKKILEPHFDLVGEQDLPFVIRETIRKHQWTVAHATIWIRKQSYS